jgi:hypothetical protein
MEIAMDHMLSGVAVRELFSTDERVIFECLYLAGAGMALRWYQPLQSIKIPYMSVREPCPNNSILLDSVSPCGGIGGFEGLDNTACQ